MTLFEPTILKPVQLRFDKQAPNATAWDKLEGLLKFGPYLGVSGEPRIAILFPKGVRDKARDLYQLLRDGNSRYKGFATTFRFDLQGSDIDVVPVDVSENDSLATQTTAYKEAVIQHCGSGPAQLYIVLHGRTPPQQLESPYYAVKAALLERNIPSQSVTFELLGADPSLEWSIGNIALASFCKLGGVPWIADRPNHDRHLIVGVGVAERHDPVSRERRRKMAYTTCTTSGGQYRFSSLGSVSESRDTHLTSLESAVRESLLKAATDEGVKELTIHMTKDFSFDERECVRRAVESTDILDQIETYVVKVTSEERFFLIDTDDRSQVPQKGQCINLESDDFLLYTDGRSDRKSYRGRFPTAIRVTQYPSIPGQSSPIDSIQRVFDLSQVNFRGFNAMSRPATLVYSEQVAELLGFGIATESLHGAPILDSMWFL
jgi:hypothetical protein